VDRTGKENRLSNKHRYGEMVVKQSNRKTQDLGNEKKNEIVQSRADLRKPKRGK
jgi:hypothetical protein